MASFVTGLVPEDRAVALQLDRRVHAEADGGRDWLSRVQDEARDVSDCLRGNNLCGCFEVMDNICVGSSYLNPVTLLGMDVAGFTDSSIEHDF